LEESNEVLCRMRLDLDGILEVTAVEKRTGKSKQITIANAMRARTAEEIAAAQKRIQDLYESRSGDFDRAADFDEAASETILELEAEAEAENVISIDSAPARVVDRQVELVLERSRRLLETMHPDDREEAVGLHEEITAAIESGDEEALGRASKALDELLFFIEGKA
jgi:molecular chaperone DnaK (HSP70)